MRSRQQTIAIILSKFRKKHGRVSKGASFQATTPSDVQRGLKHAGLPADVNIDPRDDSLNMLFARDAWDLTATEQTGTFYHKGDQYNIRIAPRANMPGIKPLPDPVRVDKFGFNKKKTMYDSTIATTSEDDNGTVRAVLDPASGYSEKIPFTPEPGFIYRGMSHEEYQHVLKTGKIQSLGEYNLGQDQVGLTFYADDPKTAAFYAGNFQPYPMIPTFGKPGYIIKIRDPKGDTSKRHPSYEGEIGITGSIDLKDVLEVVEARPYEVSEGNVELVSNRMRVDPTYTTGSRMTPQARVAYKSIGLPRVQALVTKLKKVK